MRLSFKPVHILVLAFALLLIWLRPVAASTLIDSRIRQLEYQVRSLQTQISQIPTNGPRASSSTPPNSTPQRAIPTVPGEPTLAQQFDNLAILAIELKQRVTALEEQVAQLEAEAQ